VARNAFGPSALYTGLAYPIAICLVTLLVGGLLINETKDHKIDTPVDAEAGAQGIPFGWTAPALALIAGYAFLVLVPFKGEYLFTLFGAVFWFMLPVVLFQFKFSAGVSFAYVAAVNLVVWTLKHFIYAAMTAGGGFLAFSAFAIIMLIYAALLFTVHKAAKGDPALA
jgi:hypothetical protein